ncbi:MAG: hypothetical protein EGQ64_02495 [Ruminococcaceae bacterium]|nr:hypothetical protein [Oscillospiraceae bacterium]
MKKRLLSLLLAVAMMVAMVPTAAFAGDEAGTVNSDLRINADGIPYNVSDKTQNQNNESVSGNGWNYYRHRTSQILYLGVDTAANGNINFSTSRFDFSLGSSLSSDCEIVLYNAALSNTTATKAKVIADSAGVSVTNCVLNYLSITTSKSASATVKNCIFTNSSYAIHGFSSCTLEGWNIFANDPEIPNEHTIHVINHGRITKLNVGSKKEVAMDTENLYIVGTLDSDLKLTLDDGTVYTVTSVMVNQGSHTQLEKPVPLVITSDGMPDISNMTQGLFGFYVSDDWFYVPVPSEQKLCLKSGFRGSVGPNPVKCQVENAGIITGGVFYGMVSSAFDAAGTIQGGIFLGTVAANQKIEGGVFVGTRVSGVHTVSSPAELGKIKTITLGNDTVTLDEPVDSFHFGGQPTNLSVTLEDGTVYHIDPSKEADGTVTLEPKPEEPDYYTVIVEGGEARNERGDILDSEVALTAGEKITLKLLDETQGEMVFSHWDVNNGDTALADELAKTGFDKMAHETTFTMPAHNLTLTAKYRMPEEDAPQDDSFLMTAAAVTGGAVLTGLVVWQGYNIFSQVYLNAHLPEGTAIPTNRQQLALLLWNTAGQPEASAASYVFPDVADPDVQTAARWATEQGLFKARKDGTFAPTDSVTTGQVYRAWQKVK